MNDRELSEKETSTLRELVEELVEEIRSQMEPLAEDSPPDPTAIALLSLADKLEALTVETFYESVDAED